MTWRQIKAEYIAGGISQRALAEKYDIPWGTFKTRTQKEKWNTQRKEADAKAMEKTAQKTAEIVADNATICEQIKTKLLRKLAQMVDMYPATGASEVRTKTEEAELVYRMKDLAAVYQSLSDKIPMGQSADIEDLSPLVELLQDE